MADRLTLATGDRYDTHYLLDASVTIKGFDIELVKTGPVPAPIFNDMVNKIPYDIGEQSFSNYIIARDAGRPLTAIPVFPSIFFPQLGLMASQRVGVRRPEDLVGQRLGVQAGFAFNPAVWLRGIFAHQYDVSVERITWVEGQRDSLAGVSYPRSRRFAIEKAQDLETLLEQGELAALIMAGGGSWRPDSDGAAPEVHRLFEDPYKEIRSYVEATGVTPINTVFTVKEEVARANPDLGDRVLEACLVARARYHQETDDDALHMDVRVGDLRDMGVSPHTHGIQANRKAIVMMVHYLYEPEELFMKTSVA
jgi:4,5-dihydroxyphthalate decarboxylase